jgi:transposase-like protein
VARYGQEFKDKAVARLLPPESASIKDVALAIGVSESTLERWRSEALANPVQRREWTPTACFEAVLTAAAMDEASKSAWCRNNGVYPHELATWRERAINGLARPGGR